MNESPYCVQSSLILKNIFKNFKFNALADVAQYIECWFANQKVIGSVSGQGTCLGFGPGPQMGACERQPINVSLAHRCFSPTFSPSFSLSLKNKTKNFKEKNMLLIFFY